MSIVPLGETQPSNDDIDRMFRSLIGWILTCETIHTAEIGDPLAARRTFIMGHYPRMMAPSKQQNICNNINAATATITDHLNINMNTKLCAIAPLTTANIFSVNQTCPPRHARPLGVVHSQGNNTMDNKDIILHSAYPGIECFGSTIDDDRTFPSTVQYRTTSTLDHSTLVKLLLYTHQAQTHICASFSINSR